MMRHLGFIALTVSVSLLLATPSGSRADEAAGSEPNDCGTKSLYLLLKSMDGTVELQAVAASLPPLKPGGHSLKTLRDAAAKLGFPLIGVQLPRGEDAPAYPALVFVSRETHGHFLVVLPIGHTGKLVQVLDPNYEPFVTDAAFLHQLPEWTGYALVPRQPRWSVIIGLASIASLTIVWTIHVSRKRSRRCDPGRATPGRVLSWPQQ